MTEAGATTSSAAVYSSKFILVLIIKTYTLEYTQKFVCVFSTEIKREYKMLRAFKKKILILK